MEELIRNIADRLRERPSMDEKELLAIIREANRSLAPGQKPYAKKRLMPFYLGVREREPQRWASWDIDEETDRRLLKTLQVKPRRTASGVATITVITKPWKCSSNCIYCPNDLRMPKSYLANEPACQRAERNFFDPYLQVASRLRALKEMGHVTDKIELIVLGGTWSDYPRDYQVWFISQLFAAINETSDEELSRKATERRARYRELGLSNYDSDLAAFVADEQARVHAGDCSYNDAMKRLYEQSGPWVDVAKMQHDTFEHLEKLHRINESARQRVVGLVIETRPDTINAENLALIRRLGCTKVQMGVQSLNPVILKANNRRVDIDTIQRAFELARLFGFKIHAHFMVNLLGATPEEDKQDYRAFVGGAAFQPDEVKLYPCALVPGTDLVPHYEKGSWQPYTEEELLDVLVQDVLATPPFIRISRMIRDISVQDILAGNKKANLRQLVESRLETVRCDVQEIRFRELNREEAHRDTLELDIFPYETTATSERFLQWVTPEGKIAGFLRLSLPKPEAIAQTAGVIEPGEAMIREVHVYGKVAGLHKTSEGAQHLGLGKQLIEKACALAREAGYAHINVISAIGTREYYRNQGFEDNGLYQRRTL